ncbi:MAG: hypothetical protein E6Q97_36795 [Desulfurellales bacterium]|nr:MAG: hypothetical protein E6Q97_36795 [Desulfurellales bacterium]
MKEERRSPSIRRDLNDLVRGPDGKVAEAKVFAVLFKPAMLYVFIKYVDTVLRDWMILTVFVAAFLVPDLLKKVLSTKLGGSLISSQPTERK